MILNATPDIYRKEDKEPQWTNKGQGYIFKSWAILIQIIDIWTKTDSYLKKIHPYEITLLIRVCLKNTRRASENQKL
jgi:hypothetical protein